MKMLETVDDYNSALERLIKIMNSPMKSSENKEELTSLLDVIDSYNGMAFLKVNSGKQYLDTMIQV